jgi:hypothetical protein
MKSFADFEIEPEKKCISGDKIKIERVLNVPIIIHFFQIVPSDYGGDRLDMQIEKDKTLYLLWSSSKTLIDMIKKVPPDGFPSRPPL